MSKMTMSASMFCTSSFTSATLPSPMKVRGSGESLDWVTTPTHWPPAVSSSAASSAIVSSVAFSSGVRTKAFRPTRTARLNCFCCVVSVIATSEMGKTAAPPRGRGCGRN